MTPIHLKCENNVFMSSLVISSEATDKDTRISSNGTSFNMCMVRTRN